MHVFYVYICDVCVCVCVGMCVCVILFKYPYRVISLLTPQSPSSGQIASCCLQSFTPLSMRLSERAAMLGLRLGPAGTEQH